MCYLVGYLEGFSLINDYRVRRLENKVELNGGNGSLSSCSCLLLLGLMNVFMYTGIRVMLFGLMLVFSCLF